MLCTSGSLAEVEQEIQEGMDMSLRTSYDLLRGVNNQIVTRSPGG